MPGARPKLEKLSTPLTATFPIGITSATTATPASAGAIPTKPDPDFLKTPISPPTAYTMFLSKVMPLASPLPTSSGETTPDSAPATSASDNSDCSSKSEQSSPVSGKQSSKQNLPPATAPIVPPSPFKDATLLSAPLTGPITFPSMRLPPSPAVSNMDSPHTARSPFSGRSTNTVFDWDAALRNRRAERDLAKASKTSVRHIREVVTRTVTFTPKMDPAPRGKRRKVE